MDPRSRARAPDVVGTVARGGVTTAYEVFGAGSPTILLLPTWSIIHSRCWKAQVPCLARHARVVTFDGRGNGRSDRPVGPEAYTPQEFADDAVAVMDATGTESAVIVGFSMGAQWALLLATQHQSRVSGMVVIGPALPLATSPRARAAERFEEERAPDDVLRSEGWEKFSRQYWLADYEGFLRFFFGQVFNEPHSTKQIEDAVGWGLETTPEVLIDTNRAPSLSTDEVTTLAPRISCPVLVIHGSKDAIRSPAAAAEFASLCGGTLVTLTGSGHAPHGRDPVKVNRMLRDFACPPLLRNWSRGRARGKRALYVSSPIGLGHAQRDVAIADELRCLYPDLEIDWLAQHPVTAVLEARGERIHPASAFLASESAHIESESAEHDLRCFQAWRRMDEILVANFMVFHDLVTDEHYDLWVGDEAWDVDYFLHENPELKSAAYAWLTDFVGWLPMTEGEAVLTADYNAEMLEQIERYPRVRDRAVFVGDADDVVPHQFGTDLPFVKEWTEAHYRFAGYVTGFEPITSREQVRDELGYRPDEAVCIVTVGGSGVGAHLLRRVIAAFPLARELVPQLRMVVVAGPRIDPASLGSHEGLEVRPYVHELYRHLAACDIAVVQGGLTTAMELTANRRPFLYFPLRHHFEQQIHVRHRLSRYGAGRAMDYGTDGPVEIAAAIAEEIGRTVDYRPVDPGGARRAAAAIAELL